jgi:hypothetical protein
MPWHDCECEVGRHRCALDGCRSVLPLDEGTAVCILEVGTRWLDSGAGSGAKALDVPRFVDGRFKDEDAANHRRLAVLGEDRNNAFDLDWFGNVVPNAIGGIRGRRGRRQAENWTGGRSSRS